MNWTSLSGHTQRGKIISDLYRLKFQNVVVGHINRVAALTGVSYRKMLYGRDKKFEYNRLILLFVNQVFFKMITWNWRLQSKVRYYFVDQAYPLFFRFAYSLIQCLRVLYKEKIIHCDLKPVSDFG